MTVNGSRIDIFINELFDLIYKKITIDYSDIQLLNNSLQTYLTQLKNYSSSCIQKASTDCTTLCKSASLNNNPEPNCSTIVVPTSNEIQDTVYNPKSEDVPTEHICSHCTKYVYGGIR